MTSAYCSGVTIVNLAAAVKPTQSPDCFNLVSCCFCIPGQRTIHTSRITTVLIKPPAGLLKCFSSCLPLVFPSLLTDLKHPLRLNRLVVSPVLKHRVISEKNKRNTFKWLCGSVRLRSTFHSVTLRENFVSGELARWRGTKHGIGAGHLNQGCFFSSVFWGIDGYNPQR